MTRALRGALAAVVFGGLGCDLVLGIEEGVARPPESEGGGAQGGATAPGAGGAGGGGSGAGAGAGAAGGAGGGMGGCTAPSVATFLALDDTTIDEGSPDQSNGSALTLLLNGGTGSASIALVRFGPIIPPRATICHARARFTVADATDLQGEIRLVLELWDAEATWNTRWMANPWQTVGCGEPLSCSSSLGSFNAPSTAEPLWIDLPAEVVQGWIDTPVGNFGIALTLNGAGDPLILASLDNPTPTNRPVLEIGFER